MADHKAADRRVVGHRATDLSYGYLGDASYDIDERQWSFSLDPSQNQIFEQVVPFKQSIPPPVQNVPTSKQNSPNSARSQMRWLAKSRPEAFPANDIASVFAKAPSATRRDRPPVFGQLLAIGGAVDVDHQPRYRTDPIIAIANGEAGHVLRLIRPRVANYGWGKQSAVSLSLMDAASSDLGHWVGTGGTIQQIAFADEQNVSSTLLAVRQASVITIFRPTYHRQPVPAVIPSGYAKQYPPSRLSANPITALTAERCGSRRHVDLSFNPFYSRQFAVVDDLGRWSIWDIEGRLRKRSTAELVPGKSGGIYDDYVPPSRLKGTDNADGWHRVLWATNVSTIVVCNRRHIAVFDVRTTPTRLKSPELLPARRNTDWILDIKRSPKNPSHLYVLTTSRIFWVEVITSGEDKDGHGSGIRVILSHRHFRDANDETMSLTTLKDGGISVLISSGKSLLVNFYTFSLTSDDAGSPTSSRGSFSLSTSLDGQALNDEMLHTLCFFPAPLTSNSSRIPGPEWQFVERDVKFYQIWALTSNLGLSTTLCAIYTGSTRNTSLPRLLITAPTARISLRRRTVMDGQVVVDSFIVPDSLVDDEELDRLPAAMSRLDQRFSGKEKMQDDLRFRINWRGIFQQVFMDASPGNPAEIGVSESFETVSDLVEHVSDFIKQKMEGDTLAMSSFFELSNFSSFSEDLERAAPILDDFLNSLQVDQDPDAPSSLILSDLTSCPGMGFPITQDSPFPDLLKIYDQVGDLWMASLPLKVPNLARRWKFKVARKIAVELYLSSIAASLCNKSAQIAELPGQISSGIDVAPQNNLDDESREDSPPFMSSQATNASLEAGFGLPTPSRTPSLYSYKSTETPEPTEDPIISRLRQYAVSIVSQPDLGKSALLAQWPSSPGADPAQYSWRAMGDKAENIDFRRRKEEARRCRKTERLLDRERTNNSQAKAESTPTPFGSQPVLAQPAPSSQTVDDIPMTQPDRGVFGSRSAQTVKKKRANRRAAGF